MKPCATAVFSLSQDQAQPGAAAAEITDTTCYVLRTAAAGVGARFSAGGSNGLVRVYDVMPSATLETTFSASAVAPGALAGIAFLGNSSSLSVLSTDGSISLWDTRISSSSSPSMLLRDGGGRGEAMFLCSSSDGRVIAVGHGNSIQLLDIASPQRLLARYDDTHTEDVTCLAFHPNVQKMLLSSSLDGLICCTDTSTTATTTTTQGESDVEDDALSLVLSVGHPVEGFSVTGASANTLAVITCDEQFSLWSLDSGLALFGTTPDDVDTRQRLAATTVQQGFVPDHLVGTLFDPSAAILHIVSCNATGAVGMHALDGRGMFVSAAVFPPSESRGHVALLRSLSSTSSLMFTGGEDARVCLWSSTSTSPSDSSASSPSASSTQKHALRHSPYSLSQQ